MKKQMITVVLSAILTVFCAGCGNADVPVSSDAAASVDGNASGTDESGDSSDAEALQVLFTYQASEPVTLDSATVEIDASGESILYDVAEPLIRIEDGRAVEAGCASYEYNAESMTYTFHLRDNFWEDGVAVTADDYLYALQRMVDPDADYIFNELYCIENAGAVHEGKAELSELGVSAPDEKTLVVRLAVRMPAFLETVTVYPQRKDFVERCGRAYGTGMDKFLSCGPFRLEEWGHEGIRLVKNENYWDAENVRLEEIEVAFLDAASAYQSMLDGTLDCMETSNTEYIAALSEAENITLTEQVSPTVGFLIFNCKDPVLSNVKVRQAISLAINREQFVEKVTDGIFLPAYGLVSPAITLNGISFRERQEEPLKAFEAETPDLERLLTEGLSELGMEADLSGLELTLSVSDTNASTGDAVALLGQSMQEKLGVTLVSQQSDWRSLWNACKRGNYQMAYLAWSGEMDIFYLFDLFLSDSAKMPCFYGSEEYDSMIAMAKEAVDDEERFRLYGEAERMIVVDDCLIAPVYYSVKYHALRSCVKGWDYNVFSTAGHKGVYIE